MTSVQNINTGINLKVQVGLDESRVADDVIARLAILDGASKLYQRGGELVAAVPIDDADLPGGMLRIRAIPEATLRERITMAAKLVTMTETEKGDWEEKEIRPPAWMVKAIAARGYYPGIYPLAGIVQSPTVRRDGSVLQTAGYDATTGLLYSPIADFPQVPASPTRQDIGNALKRLLDIVEDFPFLAEADKSAWTAMLFTMIARPAIDGCCPLFAITANVRGAGKSLLTDIASAIAYGRPAARESYTKDSDELRKRVLAIALEGRQFTLLDNIDCKLGGAVLDAAITSRTWTDRVLGASKTSGEIPLRTVWAATGNNLLFGSDLARRVLPIRLSSNMETPEDRQGFRHPAILQHVQRIRTELVVAVLTIFRGYFDAGCPKPGNDTWGSFEEWCAVIRGVIRWIGLADPMETRSTAREQDDSAETIGLLMSGLLEADQGDGLTAGELCELAKSGDYPTLSAAVAEICGAKIDARTLGNNLKQFYGRTVNKCRITYREGRGRIRRWRVECGDTDDTGDTVLSYRESQSGENQYTERGESESPQSPLSPNLPERTCSCGNQLAVTPCEPGWQNVECLACGTVKAERVPA